MNPLLSSWKFKDTVKNAVSIHEQNENDEKCQLEIIEANLGIYGNSEDYLLSVFHDEGIRELVERKGNKHLKDLCKEYEKIVRVNRKRKNRSSNMRSSLKSIGRNRSNFREKGGCYRHDLS